jgi:hypothetical protein
MEKERKDSASHAAPKMVQFSGFVGYAQSVLRCCSSLSERAAKGTKVAVYDTEDGGEKVAHYLTQ